MLSLELAEARKKALIGEIKALALERAPLNLHSFDQTSFWDDYSVLLASDADFGRYQYDEYLATMCSIVVNGLFESERRLLAQTTDAYFEQSGEDQSDLSEEELSKFLREELLSSLMNEALNHGEKLIDD